MRFKILPFSRFAPTAVLDKTMFGTHASGDIPIRLTFSLANIPQGQYLIKLIIRVGDCEYPQGNTQLIKEGVSSYTFEAHLGKERLGNIVNPASTDIIQAVLQIQDIVSNQTNCVIEVPIKTNYLPREIYDQYSEKMRQKSFAATSVVVATKTPLLNVKSTLLDSTFGTKNSGEIPVEVTFQFQNLPGSTSSIRLSYVTNQVWPQDTVPLAMRQSMATLSFQTLIWNGHADIIGQPKGLGVTIGTVFDYFDGSGTMLGQSKGSFTLNQLNSQIKKDWLQLQH